MPEMFKNDFANNGVRVSPPMVISSAWANWSSSGGNGALAKIGASTTLRLRVEPKATVFS